MLDVENGAVTPENDQEAEVVQPTEPETAKAEDGEEKEDASPDEDEAKEPPKPKGVQKRIDELTKAREDAKRERDYWRELALKQNQPAATQAQPQYDYYQEPFADAAQPVTPDDIERIVSARLQAEQMASKVQAVYAKVSPETADFLKSEYTPITQPIAEYIMTQEDGADVAEWLNENQDKLEFINSQPVHLQTGILAKLMLSDRAERVKAAKPISKAPAPAPRLGSKSVVEPDPDKMTVEEWMKWRQSQH